MGLWSDRVVPRVVDRSLSRPDVMTRREQVCSRLGGRVLEIGFGSGLNVAVYPPAVESVAVVEPSDLAWRLSAARRAGSRTPITRSGLDGQSLAEPDESYDAVLSTFTLCTIPDVVQALREVRRVLRPGGTFAFLEHGLAPDPSVARWQRRLDPVERRLAGGCHLSRDITGLVASAGLTVTTLDQHHLLGSRLVRPWTYLYAGAAVR